MDDSEIRDIFSPLGPVSIRRMFGGKGIYHAGRIIGLEYRGNLLLKGDAISGPDFEAAGARRWTYESRRGTPVAMPYWSVPEDAFDDPDIMAHWLRVADAAASRAPVNGKRPPSEFG